MKKLFIAFFLLSMVIFFACTEENNVVTPPGSDNNINISSLSQSTARIGEKVIIKGRNFNSYEQLYYVKLDTLPAAFNRTSDTTISVFIPYGAADGQFTLNFVSPGKDPPLTSPPITITGSCTANLCIDWNTTDAFVETDSWINDFNGTVKWDYEIHNDTIFISRQADCGDECSFRNTIAFMNNADNELPEFLFSVYKKLELLKPDINDTVKSGIIRIDKWNSAEAYSGSFSFENYNWVFWVNN